MKWHLLYFVQGFMHSLWWLQSPEIITCNCVLDPLAHAIISMLELAPRFIFLVQASPFICKQNKCIEFWQHHILMNIRIVTKKRKYLVILGTIGLSLASVAEEVRGMDVIPEAVDDANANAEANGITNAHYELGTAEELLPKWIMTGFHPDAIVVDPPRTGLDDTLIETLLAVRPPKLVYISCNPSTLAKDLVTLAHDYRVDYIQSVDMMPQTARCEAVVKLSRRV